MKASFERELVEMASELRRLAPDWKLQPMAMHTYARGGDDRVFFQKVFAGIPEVLDSVQWKRVSPSEDFAAFRGARAVVAMRFHSAVLAVAAGIPCVAIDYTRGGKMAALFSSLHGDSPMPIEGFSGRQCAARILEGVQRRPPQAPSGVEDVYVAAWRELLATSGS
jgi:polysaccharide pyruvyl transferase WcaK-like protein